MVIKVNLRDLKYFVALADTRHFGKAADACFVSQPSLSIQIQKLEKSLGVKLLERTSRSVLLTDIGKVVAEQARDVLQRAETIRDFAKQAQDPFSGQLNIGLISTLIPYLLPHVLPELVKTENYPKLKIYLTEQLSSDLVLNLKQGELDAIMLAELPQEEDFHVAPLFQEEFLLAVSTNHALATKKSIKASDLTGTELLLLEEGHCLRAQLLDFCETHGAKEAKKFRGASLEILRYMVSAEIGITLMPRLACEPSDMICYIPFRDSAIKRSINLVWRSTSAKHALLNFLVGHLRRLMADITYCKVIQ